MCGLISLLVVFLLEAAPAQAESTSLPCTGITYTLSTGSGSGACLTDDGVGLCLDPDSNSTSATCAEGCRGTNGTGSCSIAPEEPIGGSIGIACTSGTRYFLRTGTGRGICKSRGAGAALDTVCYDGKGRRAEMSCEKGCLKVRGGAMCGVYKADSGEK